MGLFSIFSSGNATEKHISSLVARFPSLEEVASDKSIEERLALFYSFRILDHLAIGKSGDILTFYEAENIARRCHGDLAMLIMCIIFLESKAVRRGFMPLGEFNDGVIKRYLKHAIKEVRSKAPRYSVMDEQQLFIALKQEYIGFNLAAGMAS